MTYFQLLNELRFSRTFTFRRELAGVFSETMTGLMIVSILEVIREQKHVVSCNRRQRPGRL